MPDIRAAQDRAWKIKRAHGFNITDVPLEFCLASGELSEAFAAWRKDPEGLGGELADVAIHLLGLAEMTGVDLGAEIDRKLTVIEGRAYVRLPNGTHVKASAEAVACRYCLKPILRCADQPSHAGCSSGYGWIHAEPYWGHSCGRASDRHYARPGEARDVA